MTWHEKVALALPATMPTAEQNERTRHAYASCDARHSDVFGHVGRRKRFWGLSGLFPSCHTFGGGKAGG